ncbi:amidase family protein [Mangrovicoccus sp. HB161399]|uniref:amidase family protein n=1 Tax=Mangrovicoccus sp. HB161399 TaxID=2720392 RepID=UPI0015574081|nr:amidase family protein [Mangrovicoccus sp. HB161399]
MKDLSSLRLTLDAARAEIARDGLPALAARLGALAAENPLNAVIAQDYAPPEGLSGPLAGLPIAVKDNTDVLPFATTGGSPALRGNMPLADAPAVAALKAAGAWVPAKLNLHELAFGITSDNAEFGRVMNPYDPERTAGGSSGGSGAAVAAGIVPAALGTDTGASVRIPAAFCGVAGFRPSTGRYSGEGVLAISWMRDTIGVLANSLADIAEIDAVIAPDDAAATALPDRKLRLGLPEDALPGYSAPLEARFRAALDHLVATGTAEIVPLPPMGYRAVAEEADFPTAMAEAHAFWTEFCAERLGCSFADFAAKLGSPDVLAIFDAMPAAAAAQAASYRAIVRHGRAKLQAATGALFPRHGIDLVVAPTSPVQPPRIAEYAAIPAGGETRPTLPVVTQNTQIATITGQPSLSLPAGLDADGLPVGMMLEGPIGTDRLLLGLALRIEAALAGLP